MKQLHPQTKLRPAAAIQGADTLDNNTITDTAVCQTGTNPSPVPEPSTLLVLGTTLFALGAVKRHKRKTT